MVKGEKITKVLPNTLTKDFANLTISIKPRIINISRSNTKELVAKKYLPPL